MWLRRDKWVGFYEGTYAPHLGDGACPADAAAKLPWRNGQPASQLLEFLQEHPGISGRALELGCGTGENLVALARRFVACGLDIAPEAQRLSTEALEAAGLEAQVLCADIFDLPFDGPAGGWQFDFIFDCQCFHCLYQVDAAAAARAIAGLLAPGGTMLMLTGNSEEEASRGPVQLSREQVLHAFDGTGLVCKELTSTRFDWTETYRRQPFEDPPLGWLSVWTKPPALE
ncbi:unnamed protein product [Effrenium voratum]|nr:unnamed protein product [Effrenium voratum]